MLNYTGSGKPMVRKKPVKSKAVEIEAVVISSDDEEDDQKKLVKSVRLFL